MISRFTTLKTKLQDEEYIESLCYRRKNELKICQEILTEEELNYHSSIAVAYNIARKRYIQSNFDEDFIKAHKLLFMRYI
jgi:hypothetical protein